MKVAIIGAGAMGGAIARGLISSAPRFITSPGDLCAANPSPQRLA
ncbi:NAD(P)-binding domain-containing protein, partial [uncultured Duncaniella sp.]